MNENMKNVNVYVYFVCILYVVWYDDSLHFQTERFQVALMVWKKSSALKKKQQQKKSKSMKVSKFSIKKQHITKCFFNIKFKA